MKSLLLSICMTVLLFPQGLSAQPPATEWTQLIGGSFTDGAISIIQISNGDYVFTGITDSYGAGGYDVYLVKTNSSGETIWWNAFGEIDDDEGLSIQETTDGGFIISGSSESPGSTHTDLYLVKTNSSGNVQWANVFGGSYSEVGRSVIQTADGGYLVAGYTVSYGVGGRDVYLVKTHSTGNVMWTKTIGGTSDDEAYCIQQTSDGGYIISGRTQSSGAGSSDVYLIKTDSFGNIAWTRTFGGSNYDSGKSVRETSDGGYIITGVYQSVSTGADIYLIRTNSFGEALWTKTFGGSSYESGESVQETADGGFIVLGTTTISATDIDIYLVRTASNGDSLWTTTYGGTDCDMGNSVLQTDDQGYMIAGFTNSFSADSIDAYLIKLATDTGIEEEHGSNSLFTLETAGPNPFSSSLAIAYSIPEQSMVDLAVFDLSGRQVEELENSRQPQGTHTVTWSPEQEMPNGYYYVVLNACGLNAAVRCLLLN